MDDDLLESRKATSQSTGKWVGNSRRASENGSYSTRQNEEISTAQRPWRRSWEAAATNWSTGQRQKSRSNIVAKVSYRPTSLWLAGKTMPGKSLCPVQIVCGLISQKCSAWLKSFPNREQSCCGCDSILSPSRCKATLETTVRPNTDNKEGSCGISG